MIAECDAMTFRSVIKRHRYLAQASFVVLLTVVCELVADFNNFRSPINLVWMFVIPIGVGMAANVGWDRRCFMVFALLCVSLIVAVVVGTNFTSYG
ncbi:ABC-type polysaccharide/polyol phosphate export permease [Sphingomonas sp. SORGH_AS789]|nr:ABC-type polysaccharide/polyol phosphate export permease [Sphingomonas sp. SORGH_AS_0789]MDR6151459.1 ABC-type polysaccharide/polyol phosphate export permease [Sphingomonas sp. SORGH_AS_0742]